jgi:transposase InsO family protein
VHFWRRRWLVEGLAGLEDRSSVPHRSPGRLAAVLEATIVDLRQAHPRWGARRIRAELGRRGQPQPAVSTVHRVLVRAGLVCPTPPAPRASGRFERGAPNELWQMDSLDVIAGGQVVPVGSVVDDHSRLCCAIQGFPAFDSEAAIELFDTAVGVCGLPHSVLSDRHAVFTGRRTQTVSWFERHLWRQGIVTINGRAYHPQTQGKIERYHRTLREWLADNDPVSDLETLNATLDRFRHHYNTERPHQGIADHTPAERFAATPPRGPDPTANIDRRQREALRSTGANGNVRYGEWVIGLGHTWANTEVRIIDYGDRIAVHAGDQLIRAVTPTRDVRYIGTGRSRGRPRRHPIT